MENKDCLFCKIIRGDIEADIIYNDDNFIAIFDINPEVENHVLVIPKKHFKTLLDVPNSLAGEFLDAIKKVGLKLVNEGKAEGFNVVFNTHKCAQQLVDHVHAHILPRKEGDGRNLTVVNGLKWNKKGESE